MIKLHLVKISIRKTKINWLRHLTTKLKEDREWKENRREEKKVTKKNRLGRAMEWRKRGRWHVSEKKQEKSLPEAS